MYVQSERARKSDAQLLTVWCEYSFTAYWGAASARGETQERAERRDREARAAEVASAYALVGGVKRVLSCEGLKVRTRLKRTTTSGCARSDTDSGGRPAGDADLRSFRRRTGRSSWRAPSKCWLDSVAEYVRTLDPACWCCPAQLECAATRQADEGEDAA